MLYLGEGAKSNKGMARLANSDPAVIQMMMRFFREVCNVPEKKFHAYIHTYENADVKKQKRIGQILQASLELNFIKPM